MSTLGMCTSITCYLCIPEAEFLSIRTKLWIESIPILKVASADRINTDATPLQLALYNYAIPGPNVFSPRGKSFPHPEPGEGANLDELVEVVQVADPLVQICELRLATRYHPSHSLQTESGIVRLVHFGVHHHSEVGERVIWMGDEGELWSYYFQSVQIHVYLLI